MVGGAPGADCMGTIFPPEMPFFTSCRGNKKYLPAAAGTSPQMGEKSAMAAVALPASFGLNDPLRLGERTP